MGKEEPQPGVSAHGWLEITVERFRDNSFHHPLERSG